MAPHNAAGAASKSAGSSAATAFTTPPGGAPSGSFDGLTHELSDELDIINTADRRILKAKDVDRQHLPGQPRVRLSAFSQHPDPAHNQLLDYLREEHLTTGLDDLLPYMRYIFVQTPSYRHIMPLHHQKAHAREVMVNEKAGLHLVWYYERMFIKPIPAYFYSQAFWDYLRQADEDVFAAAVGFMRSYYYLIQYPIDFEDGCKMRLIPKKPDGHYPTYEEFCKFMEPFVQVDDNHVSRRFHYGELRLTRINRTAFLFRRRLAYFHIYPQWGSFLAHIFAPVITVFAIFSVVLNSMQVGLAALAMGPGNEDSGWPAFISVSVYFPVAIIIFVAGFLSFALLCLAIMGIRDFIRGNRVRRRKKKGDLTVEDEKTHGMVW
ncbi:hypothetical protein QBC47DRAFT_153965 [Echria macrotheca]|uniref:Uncharacterized protein n=1 Tax=Echria macrotheca TaxID=438768 RepID=A0AAJ0BFG2_9PEZI|nr:hypothetical protein QBC47DRAFT_153965 [Echria macrotheca]